MATVINGSGDSTFNGNIIQLDGSPEYHFATDSATHYNWRIAAQEQVNGGFEIASGTQTAGSNASSDTYTNRLVIDSAGRVTMPYQPAFSTTKNDGDISGALTQVVFNEVQLNIGNCYNSSTGAFTAPVSGTYQFYVYGMFSNSARTGWLQLTGNDTWIAEFNPYQELNTTSFDWNQVNGSLLVYLNAGDYVKVRLGNSGGMGYFYAVGNRHNGFSGHLVG